MPFGYSVAYDPTSVWNVLRSAVVGAGSMGEWAKQFGRETEFLTLGLLQFARGATLGTDNLDGGGVITHSVNIAVMPLHSNFASGNVTDNDVGSRFTANDIARAARRPEGGEGGTLVYETRVALQQTAACRLIMGFRPPTETIEQAQESAYFFYDSSIGGNILCRSYVAGEEQTDTGVAMNLEWHVYRIEIVIGAVRFYLDDVLVATHVTEVPGPGFRQDMQYVGPTLRTLANVIKDFDHEYSALWNE